MPTLLLGGLVACSSNDSYTYRPSSPSASAAITSSGASGTADQPAVVVGTVQRPRVVSNLTAAGVNFIYQAGFFGAGAVEIGELAQHWARSPTLRNFATVAVRDHTIANVALNSAGTTVGVVPPAVPDSGRQAALVVLEGLEGLPGTLFDHQYVQQQLSDYRVALALYAAEAQNGEDPDLRSFAVQYLPMLQGDYDQLAALAGQILVSSR
jgi:putative membrane protein